MQVRLRPLEKVCLDNIRLQELHDRLGSIGAENTIDRAMEELAVRLAKIVRLYDAGKFVDVRGVARGIVTISDQVGMLVLANVARDVADLTMGDDSTALAATMARLLRIGEKSLMAVWAMQDLSG